MDANNRHTVPVSDVARALNTDVLKGLTCREAELRLSEQGPNELEERGLKSPLRIMWDQFAAALVVILIIASVISFFIGETKDAAAILIIVLLNALLGFYQEHKAEKAMAALRALAVPGVRVRREGRVHEISARELVPGDIILLEAGNLVPADGRVSMSFNLRLQESALTGESATVTKESEETVSADVPPADRINMVYMGTVVTFGRGEAIVTETGMKTELGRIAAMIQTVKRESTPLQKKLGQLGHGLAVAALAVVIVIFALGIVRGGDIREMFLLSISLAVAAVPEGLPAVVTIALALGSQRMLKRRALIRKLPAVETLGSVTVICTDKTGTLTENRMTATVLDLVNQQVEVKDLHAGLQISSEASQWAPHWPTGQAQRVALMLIGGALCNDASLDTEMTDADQPMRALQAIGDPTETALVSAAALTGLFKAQLDVLMPRISEMPFDSNRKRMSTLHRLPASGAHIFDELGAWMSDEVDFAVSSYVVFAKGAVDSVVNVSLGVLANERIELLDDRWRELISQANDRLAGNGMRVLGLAFRPLGAISPDQFHDELEKDLIFVGMVGIMDPPRVEAKASVARCISAGIRPVMITGDHPLTAQHIASELGISGSGQFLTGLDLDVLSVEELEDKVEAVSLFARVTPEHKLNIVQALQNRNHIVAMTGDGVNDAPALKKADIGVAMGITGTDVAKEVADMVLMDDNFATIVAAVEEGRIIYDNIRKFIKYMLSTNSGELLVMLVAPFLGMPLPLLPLQILWINLVTDGLPALALGLEQGEPDVMSRPPYRTDESIFASGLGWHIIWVGFLMGVVPLWTGYQYWQRGEATWQTMLFMILILSQLCQAMAVRSGRYSIFRVGILSNPALLAAVLFTFVLQLCVIYMPFAQTLFKTTALSASDLGICILLSSVVFWAVEFEKCLFQKLRVRRCN